MDGQVADHSISEWRNAYADGLTAVAERLEASQYVGIRLSVPTGDSQSTLKVEARGSSIAISHIREILLNVEWLVGAIPHIHAPAELTRALQSELEVIRSRFKRGEAAIVAIVALGGEEIGIRNAVDMFSVARQECAANTMRLAAQVRTLPTVETVPPVPPTPVTATPRTRESELGTAILHFKLTETKTKTLSGVQKRDLILAFWQATEPSPFGPARQIAKWNKAGWKPVLDAGKQLTYKSGVKRILARLKSAPRRTKKKSTKLNRR